MKGMINWFAHNSVAANLLMLMIIAGGILATFSVREEVFPEIELDMNMLGNPILVEAGEILPRGRIAGAGASTVAAAAHA